MPSRSPGTQSQIRLSRPVTHIFVLIIYDNIFHCQFLLDHHPHHHPLHHPQNRNFQSFLRGILYIQSCSEHQLSFFRIIFSKISNKKASFDFDMCHIVRLILISSKRSNPNFSSLSNISPNSLVLDQAVQICNAYNDRAGKQQNLVFLGTEPHRAQFSFQIVQRMPLSMVVAI